MSVEKLFSLGAATFKARPSAIHLYSNLNQKNGYSCSSFHGIIQVQIQILYKFSWLIRPKQHLALSLLKESGEMVLASNLCNTKGHIKRKLEKI